MCSPRMGGSSVVMLDMPGASLLSKTVPWAAAARSGGRAGLGLAGSLTSLPVRLGRGRVSERQSIRMICCWVGTARSWIAWPSAMGRGRPQPILTWTTTGAVDAHDLGGVRPAGACGGDGADAALLAAAVSFAFFGP